MIFSYRAALLSSTFAMLACTNVAAARSQPAVGPSTAASPAMPGDEAGADIVVTGSRIRRANFDTPSPVVTVNADILTASGSTNLTDVLTAYPSLLGSLKSSDTAGGRVANGLAGMNLLNLRNLGTQRTLILVDGRRHVSTVPATQAVDINVIPTDLIERVDVLTGGASAIYGADGVSGVVNFILKKDFEGVSVRGQAGISERGDAGQRLIAITAGHNFAQGRGNIALAYEHSEEDRLDIKKRPALVGARAVGFYPNPDDPENQFGYTGGASNGIPDNIPLSNVRYSDTSRDGAIDIDGDGLPDYVMSGGRLTAFDHGQYVAGYAQQGGSGTLASDYYVDLLPRTNRDIINLIGHFDVSPALTLFVEGKFAQTKAYTFSQPSYDYNLLIARDNAYIPADLLPLVGPDGLMMTRDNFDMGSVGENSRRRTYRSVVGARDVISDHAAYELSYTYGRTDIRTRSINNSYNDRFYAAIDAVIDPVSGQPTCRVNLDPSWTPNQPATFVRNVVSPISFQPGECVPLNLFGEGAPSQAAIDFITAQTVDRSKLQQHVVSGSISGDFGAFFALPGGPVGFALGGEYRKELSRFDPDPLSMSGNTFNTTQTPGRGSFSVKEVFGELRAPLLRDVPFAHRLEIGAAIRLSDYSTVGGTTAWKVDGLYSPTPDISFAGTYSVAVRAPNISELYAAPTQTIAGITDPCNSNEIQNGTQYRAANCAALLASLGVTDPVNYIDSRYTALIGTTQGNAGLSEERAKTWTAGIVLTPRAIPGLSLRADWYDIRLHQAINTATAAELAELCVDQPTLDNGYCTAIDRQSGATGVAEAGNITGFSVAPFNVAQFRTAGLDVNLNYSRATDIGTFNLNVSGNYLDRLTFIPTPGADVTNKRGEMFAPKFSANVDLAWTMGAVTVNYGLSWFDRTLRYTNQELIANPDSYAPEYTYVKALWQHDLSAKVEVAPGFEFYGGVRNVFDQKPELATRIYPVSAVGRTMFAGFRAKM